MVSTQKVSGMSFKQGVYIHIDYVVDYTNTKKGRKGGSGFSPLINPCFTKSIRGKDMLNYQSNNKEQYIFNVENKDDNLCFLYNLIALKYLSEVLRKEFLKYEGNDAFKSHYIEKLKPFILPQSIIRMQYYLPFIVYPKEDMNLRAKSLLDDFFPNKYRSEILAIIQQNDFNTLYKYSKACSEFAKYLNASSMFPLKADYVDLINDFEKLNQLTINIFSLNKKASNPDCKKRRDQLWYAKYMTETRAKDIKVHSHVDM